MFRNRFLCLVLTAGLLMGIALPAGAVEVDCDATYCFTAEDFSEEAPLVGICITQLPQPATGTVLLGHRVLRAGDILTADQISQLTFLPVRTEADVKAEMTYLPIYENRVEQATTMAIAVRGKEDKAPVAQDLTLETYKNLPNGGTLKVTDPEGQPMVFTVTRQPRRGEVLIDTDGSFHYTPKKNKVGVDSFTYTATDPAGNVSREATVTVRILKPSDAPQYTDTLGEDCRFAAEWLKNTGLFVGEQLSGQLCFQPEKAVSRGEFLTMLLQALEVPVDTYVTHTVTAPQTPKWLKPYVSAAMRAGLFEGWPQADFEAGGTITGEEAAVLLQNVLDLPTATVSLDTDAEPTWGQTALATMAENGICLTADAQLTRGEAAKLLYQVHQLAASAPGMAVLKMQE